MPYRTLTIIFILSLLLVVTRSSPAQNISHTNTSSESVADYRLDVALHTGHARIIGQQRLEWRNTSSQPVHSLAFRGEMTNPHQESSGADRVKTDANVAIDSIIIRDGNDAVDFAISAARQTGDVAKFPLTWVTLRQPLLPGREVQIQIRFHTQLVNAEIERQSQPVYFAARWYPKVFFVSYTEKSPKESQVSKLAPSGFDNYQVYITTSTTYNVAASGALIATEVSDSIKTFHFSAKRMHSFAWIAGSSFVEVEGKRAHPGIRLFLQRSNKKFQDRYLAAIQNALEYLEASCGKFPYGQITIIDFEDAASVSSIAYYPTLILVPAMSGFSPGNNKFIERGVFYASAAQYWSGLIAPYESDDSWLLSGLAAYSGMRMMDIYLGKSANLIDFMGFRLNDAEFNRLVYLKSLSQKRKLYWFLFPANFNIDWFKLHAKAALFWSSAAYQFGPRTWEKILHTYLQQWQVRRPTVQDFINLCNRISGKNSADLLNQVLDEDNVLDYAIDSLLCIPKTTQSSQESPSQERATTLAEQTGLASLETSQSVDFFETSVIVARHGTFEFPVVLEVHFEDGSKERAYWDGRGRKRRFAITSRSEAASATIDPDQKILLDCNLANNSKTTKSQLGDEKIATRWLFWLQNLMLLLTSFTG